MSCSLPSSRSCGAFDGAGTDEQAILYQYCPEKTLLACSAGGKESAMGKVFLQDVKHAFQALIFDLQQKPDGIKDTEFVRDILRPQFGQSSRLPVTFWRQ